MLSGKLQSNGTRLLLNLDLTPFELFIIAGGHGESENIQVLDGGTQKDEFVVAERVQVSV